MSLSSCVLLYSAIMSLTLSMVHYSIYPLLATLLHYLLQWPWLHNWDLLSCALCNRDLDSITHSSSIMQIPVHSRRESFSVTILFIRVDHQLLGKSRVELRTVCNHNWSPPVPHLLLSIDSFVVATLTVDGIVSCVTTTSNNNTTATTSRRPQLIAVDMTLLHMPLNPFASNQQ